MDLAGGVATSSGSSSSVTASEASLDEGQCRRRKLPRSGSVDGDDRRLADVCPAAGKSSAAGARSLLSCSSASCSRILANSVEDAIDCTEYERRECWDLDTDLVRRNESRLPRGPMVFALRGIASAVSAEASSATSGSTVV